MRRISVLILLAALSGVLLLSSCFPAWKPGEEQTSIREEVTTPGQENPPEPPNPYEMRLVNEITLENLPKSERTKELKNLTFSSSFLSSSLTHDSRVLDSIRDSYQLASHVRIYNLQQQKQWLTIEYMLLNTICVPRRFLLKILTWYRSATAQRKWESLSHPSGLNWQEQENILCFLQLLSPPPPLRQSAGFC